MKSKLMLLYCINELLGLIRETHPGLNKKNKKVFENHYKRLEEIRTEINKESFDRMAKEINNIAKDISKKLDKEKLLFQYGIFNQARKQGKELEGGK